MIATILNKYALEVILGLIVRIVSCFVILKLAIFSSDNSYINNVHEKIK